MIPDESGKKATAVTWRQNPIAGTMLTDPGVYCLLSSEVDLDEATLWRTYAMLTDLEAVLRSLKSELVPIYHSKADRAEGHLFITVIAYQLVQVIRRRLREHGSSARLCRILGRQQRSTTTFQHAHAPCAPVLRARRSRKGHLYGAWYPWRAMVYAQDCRVI